MNRSTGVRRAALFAAPLLLLLALPAGVARAAKPIDRHNWAVGLGVNFGHADVTLKQDTDLQTGWARGAAPQFRFGHMIGPHLMLSIEDRQWLDEGGIADHKVRANFQNFDLVVTAYPGKPNSMMSGLFLQAGYGIAHARTSLLEPIPGGGMYGDTYEVVEAHDEGGTGYLFGIGYELQVMKHAAVGIAASYNSLSFDDAIFDTAKFYPIGLNFNWYF